MIRNGNRGLKVGERHDSRDCEECEREIAFLRRSDRPNYEGQPPRIRVVDLFCGCGGMTLGAAEAARESGFGFEVALAIDSDQQAVDVYRHNFPQSNVVSTDVESWFDGEIGSEWTDKETTVLRQVDAIDVLLAGPPCQGHSNLNNHTRNDDPRNALYLRVSRAAEVFRPKVIVIENVPSVTRDKGRVVQLSVDSLHGLGYGVATGVANALDMGLPQSRRRHFLLALFGIGKTKNRDFLAHNAFDSAIKQAQCSPRTVEWAIRDLDEIDVVSNYDLPPMASAENRNRMRWLIENDCLELPNELRPPCHRNGHRYKSIYGRLSWDKPAQTITTGFRSMGQGRYVHPSKPRTLTAHEAARLQGFPDFFDFGETHGPCSWARLIGNAVPPIIARSFVAAAISPNRQNSERPPEPKG